MKAKRLECGNVKVALYPAARRGPWVPTDQQIAALEDLAGNGWKIEEVSGCGAQSYHVLVDFEDFAVARTLLAEAEAAVLLAINGSRP